MLFNEPFARRLRLRRMFRHDPSRLLIVPLDHSVTDGPTVTGTELNLLVGELALNQVDAIVLHKGSTRAVDPGWFNHTSLIVHLSASTVHAPDPNSKYLVASVEECSPAICTNAPSTTRHVRPVVPDTHGPGRPGRSSPGPTTTPEPANRVLADPVRGRAWDRSPVRMGTK